MHYVDRYGVVPTLLDLFCTRDHIDRLLSLLLRITWVFLDCFLTGIILRTVFLFVFRCLILSVLGITFTGAAPIYPTVLVPGIIMISLDSSLVQGSYWGPQAGQGAPRGQADEEQGAPAQRPLREDQHSVGDSPLAQEHLRYLRQQL